MYDHSGPGGGGGGGGGGLIEIRGGMVTTIRIRIRIQSVVIQYLSHNFICSLP